MDLPNASVRRGGVRLGTVGSRIVAEVFVSVLDGDALSFRWQNPALEPTLYSATLGPQTPGKYTMVDLLRFVDDINPIGE